MNPNKALWEKGDFTRIAESMRESGEELVQKLGVTKGMKVLDLGCGDGTTALPEARLGADVLGVDIAANLVEAGEQARQVRRPRELQVSGRRRHRPARSQGRFVRSRREHLRRDVRAEAVRRRQGDDAGDAAGRPDRDGELDSERSDPGGANPEDQRDLLASPAGGLREPNDLGGREQRDRAIWRRRRPEGQDLVRQGHLYLPLCLAAGAAG